MSDTTNNGGPAFPVSSYNYANPDSTGMTMRDYFAAKAMAVDYALAKNFTDPDWRYGIALDAYKMADAMLKARGQS